MNIDRDDEYATRYEMTEPTIEKVTFEASVQHIRNSLVCETLSEVHPASLVRALASEIVLLREKLAALDSQPVPVEPERVKAMRSDTWCGGDVSEALRYIDTLQSALHRAQEKYEQAVSNKQIAEAQCAELLQRAEKAEAINRRMVELLKEPSEGMIAAGYPPNDERAQSWVVTEVFKAMSAELLKEATKCE